MAGGVVDLSRAHQESLAQRIARLKSRGKRRTWYTPLVEQLRKRVEHPEWWVLYWPGNPEPAIPKPADDYVLVEDGLWVGGSVDMLIGPGESPVVRTLRIRLTGNNNPAHELTTEDFDEMCRAFGMAPAEGVGVTYDHRDGGSVTFRQLWRVERGMVSDAAGRVAGVVGL